MVNEEKQILLFDGVCNLCNRMVQFTIKRDPEGKFRFASLQSKSGQSLLRRFGLPTDQHETFVYVRGDQFFLRSSAALEVFKELGGAWKLLYIFKIIPLPVRDAVYDLIASSRYRLAGRRDTCMMPTPELKKRFLT